MAREREFAAEREETRISSRFGVPRGLQTLFERWRRAVPLTYDALLTGLGDVFRVVVTSAADSERARGVVDAQRGEIACLQSDLAASRAEVVELWKAVSELTVLRGERNAWRVERDNAVKRAEIAEVAEWERSVALRDTQEILSGMGTL